ncbi:hypothetical protein [Pedobacter agri]|uniref:hypothetical protein n=1 Tax=Pedobacter agri TaxID=454586 RepID=UPI00278AA72F|nr:hypothetical protein [Pedobacter agri]MDQ1142751.1 hypothetical protein [Pedobacter agri]
MRTGTILSYNKKIKQGVIKDANGQKIRFLNANDKVVYKAFEVVRFEIAFVNSHLRAINIDPVIDGIGNRLNLEIRTN